MILKPSFTVDNSGSKNSFVIAAVIVINMIFTVDDRGSKTFLPIKCNLGDLLLATFWTCVSRYRSIYFPAPSLTVYCFSLQNW